MLEKPTLTDEAILDCLQAAFGVRADLLEFLPVGNDATAWAYRVRAAGASYFLKVKSGKLKEAGLTIPRYLHDQGLGQVVAPLPTPSGLLYLPLEGFSLILYPYITGLTGMQAGLDSALRQELGAVLQKIHSLALPPRLAAQLPWEAFTPPWIPVITCLEETLARGDLRSPEAHQLAVFWREKQTEIDAVIARATKTGQALQSTSLDFVLCHADFHDANLLIDPTGRLFIVDWDEIILAPKERDLVFVTDTPGDSRRLQETQARLFFEGYGPTYIDPLVLQYYQDEWTVQEIGDFGERILLRDDLGAQTRQAALNEFMRQFPFS